MATMGANRVGRLLTLVRETARAQRALLVAQVQLWTTPRGALLAPQAETAEERGALPPLPPISIRDVAWRNARAVRRAARYGLFRPKCLARSLALQRLLERDGVQGSVIRVGVRRTDGRFAAHAWVELAGRVIGDDRETVAAYTDLARFRKDGASPDGALAAAGRST